MTEIDADFTEERFSLMGKITNILFSLFKTTLKCNDEVARQKAIANAEFDLVGISHQLEWFFEGQLREDVLRAIFDTCKRLTEPSLIALVRTEVPSDGPISLRVENLEKYVDEQIVDVVFRLWSSSSHEENDMVGGALCDALVPLHGFVKRGRLAFADYASCLTQILLLYVIIGERENQKIVRGGVIRMYELSIALTRAIDSLLA